ncbi:MAG: DNA polymerase Y family protein [Roseibium sp.]|nr:DNA polymerase Y family protein [Roseibium sp.]
MRRDSFLRQRVLSLWFPDLPADRIIRRLNASAPPAARAAEPPFAVVAKTGNVQRLCALNQTAQALGLKAGGNLADARARVPHLLIEEAAPDKDAALLDRLADWCDRYTPLVALDGPDGLFLDITGCAHLFDGEAALLADALKRLHRQGFTVRGAIAGTPGAAWAKARYGTGGCVPPGQEQAALEGLPVAALRLARDVAEGLERVGLSTVGALSGRPRAPLANRFGVELIQRLDQALGREREAISPRFAVPLVVAERRFFEPIGRMEDVQAVLLSLAGQVAEALERRVEGGRAFEMSLFRADGAVQRVVVGTSRPLRAPKRILALFAEKLKADESVLDAGYGYDLIRLSVLEAEAAAPDQLALAGKGQAQAEADLTGLVDRLGARLGIDRVTRLLPVDRHLPESQTGFVPAAIAREDALSWVGFGGTDFGLGHLQKDGDPVQAEIPAAGGFSEEFGADWQQIPLEIPLVRPLRLIDPAEPVEAVAVVPEGPPLRFRWRRVLYKVARSEGPERIAPPWWVGAPDAPPPDQTAVTRDYFRIEDEDGRRFWLYREGLYARETTQPRWYMQGVFA